MDVLFTGSPYKRRRSVDDVQESSPLKPGTISSNSQQLRSPSNAAAAAAAAAAATATAAGAALSPSSKQRCLPPDEFRAMVSAGWDRALRHIPDAVEEAPAQQQTQQPQQQQQQQQPCTAPMQSPSRALLAEHRPAAAMDGPQAGAVDAFAVLRSAQAAQVPMEAQMFLEGRGDGTWAFHWRLAGAPWADGSLPEQPAWSATVKANLPRQQHQHQHAAQAGAGAASASGSGSSKGGMPTGSVKLRLEVSTNIPPGFGTAVDWENPLLCSNGLGAAASAQPAQGPGGQQQQQQGTQGFEPAAAAAAAAGGSMRWRGGGSVVLISALQKSVRRGCAASATKVALELLKDPKGAEALTRRLAVVCLEDGLLHPQLPLVVWTMMALSKGYVIGGHLANALLTITHQMASMQCRDFMPHDLPSVPAAGVYTAPASWHSVDAALGGPSSQEAILVKCMLIRAAYGGMSCDKDMLLAYAGLWTARFSGSMLPPPPLRPAQPPAVHPAAAAAAVQLSAAQPPAVHLAAVAAAAGTPEQQGITQQGITQQQQQQQQQMPAQQQAVNDGQQQEQEQAEAQQQEEQQEEQQQKQQEVHEQQTLEEQQSASQHGTQQLRPQWLQADAQQQPHVQGQGQGQGQEQVVHVETQLLDAAPQEDQQQEEQEEQQEQAVLPPKQLASEEQHQAAAAVGAGAGAPSSSQPGSRSHAPCSSQPGGSSSSPAAAAGGRPQHRCTDRAGGRSSSSGTSHYARRSSPWLHFLQQQYRQLGPDTVQRVTVVGAVGREDVPLAAVDMHVAPGLTQHLQEQPQLRAAVRSMITSSAAVAARLSALDGFENLLNSALWLFRSSINRKAWLQAQYLTAAAAAGAAGGQVSRQQLEAAANAAVAAWTPVLDPGCASKEGAAAAGAGKVWPGGGAASGSFMPASASTAAVAATVPGVCLQDQDMPDVPAAPDQQPTVTLQPGTGFSEGALRVLEMELNALMAHEAQQHAARQELMPLWRAGLATLSDAWCRDYVNRRLY